MSRPPPKPTPPPGHYSQEDDSKKRKKDRVEKPLARQPPKRPAGTKPTYQPEGMARQQIGAPGKPPPKHDPPVAASTAPGMPPVRVRENTSLRTKPPLPTGPPPENRRPPQPE